MIEVRHCDVQRADRFRLRPPARPGDAGDADAVRRVEAPPHSLRQIDGDLL